MKARLKLVVAIGLPVLLAGVVVILGQLGSTANEFRPASSSALGDEVDNPAQRLLELLANSRTLEYQAQYLVQSNDAETRNGTFQLRVWRKPPMVRRDTDGSLAGQRGQSASYFLPSGKQRCDRHNSDPWVCRAVTGPESEHADDLVAMVREEIQGLQVARRAERIRGRDLSCFYASGRGETPIKICVTEEGIPAFIGSSSLTIEMESLAGKVPLTVFAVPPTNT